ncbi:MAG: DUF4330 domain-containing protein [Clostridia bacterium]|nr:DUF4330 domain-containing protein [Clostridia bacterium]
MKRKMSQTPTDAGASKKIRRGFNFIDLFLILFVIAVVLIAVNIVSPMSFIDKLKSDSTHTIQYTVEFIGVDEEYIDSIKEEDIVVDSVSKSNMGSVTVADYNTRYSALEYSESAQAGVLTEYKDKYNVTVTITAEASYTEGYGYSVNNTRIAVGEKLSLRFPNYVGEGHCISFSVES